MMGCKYSKYCFM